MQNYFQKKVLTTIFREGSSYVDVHTFKSFQNNKNDYAWDLFLAVWKKFLEAYASQVRGTLKKMSQRVDTVQKGGGISANNKKVKNSNLDF